MDRRIFHVKEQLSQTLGRSWTVQEMASSVGLSVPRFKQLFKEKVGISPMVYLLELRLEKAREMLADTHSFLQIKEIGVKSGLTNDSHFTREFKKKFGVTPTEFREHSAEIEQSIPPDGQE
jgi:AraC-like DNA-binding protein